MPIDEITPIVRRAVGDDSAIVASGRTVESMSVDSVGQGTLGFLRVSGRIRNYAENTGWHFVVKVLEPSVTSFQDIIDDFSSPAREIGAFESGFLGSLDGGFRAAPCHGITRLGSVTLLWLADLSDSLPHPWGQEEFLVAARQVGIFNGSWPEHRAPDGDWLDTEYVTNRPMSGLRSGWNAPLKDAGASPVVAELAAVSGVTGIENMYYEMAEITESVTAIPRTVCHNDFHSRNAFFRYEATGPVTYAIDWASVGLGPVGIDGGTLAGGGLGRREEEALLAGEIEKKLFDEYVRGLDDAGFQCNADQTRLGYLCNIAPYLMNYILAAVKKNEGPMWDRMASRFGVNDEEMLEHLASRLRTFKPLFDEAVALARQLG